MTSDEGLQRAVAATSGAISTEMQDLLRLVSRDAHIQGPDALALVVRGASTAALDALREGARGTAEARLTRLVAGSWLLLITMTLAEEGAAPAAQN